MNRDEKQISKRPDRMVVSKKTKKKKKWLFSKKQTSRQEDKRDELWNLPIKPKGTRAKSQSPSGPGQRPKGARPKNVKTGPMNQKQRISNNLGTRTGDKDLKRSDGLRNNELRRNNEHKKEKNQKRHKEIDSRRQRREDPNYKNIRVYKQDELNEKVAGTKNEQRKRLYFGIVGFIIFLYFGSNIYRMFTDSGIETMQLSKITIDTPKVYDSLIIRNESVTAASKAGEVDYKISNNEKARVGDLVATIIDENSIDEVYNISSEEFTAVSKITNSDVENINDRIKSEFSYSKINDYAEAYIYSEKIYESLEIRNQIIMSTINANEGSTSVKSAERESLYTVKSGIINYNIDSYEDVYTVDKLDSIVIDDIKNVSKTDTSVRNKVVTVGENVFKVIESNTWYVVSFIDNSEIKFRGIELNKNMEIYLSKANTFTPVLASVYSISEGEKTSKIVFQCDSFIGDFAEQRSVSVKLAKENVEGYKVPKTAILQKDAVAIYKDFVFFSEDKGYEYVIKEGYNGEQYEVPVVKYSTTENIVYVLKDTTDLNMGDMLLNGDKKYQIPEIYKINGVYVVNTGIAVFKEVFPSSDTLADESLVFLESKNNTNIRIHDTIAANIDEVSENEIIY